MKTEKARSRSSRQQDEAEHLSAAQVLAVVNGAGEFPVRIDRILESLRYAEYDINSGIAELVDNAIESGARNTWIFVSPEKRTFKGKALEVVSEIAVVDDGIGMPRDILGKCLVLGETLRPIKRGGHHGIGRFGVGLTLGAISLGRRVEVFSRQRATDPFLFTYLDLDEIGDNRQRQIPPPVAKDVPPQYLELVAQSSGTIVVITNCDRLQTDPVQKEKGILASEQVKGLPTFLGRTYRKFIDTGRKLWLNSKPVYLHDPLFELGPTRFDIEAAEDGKSAELKAEPWGNTDEIELEIPDQPGKKAKVLIRITLLPREWRSHIGAGGSRFALERKIDDNEGISILRADREVLYSNVPYIIGKKGEAGTLVIDRWWGCEISFPPELDDYFHVRYIKRGAEPVVSVRDQIRERISPAIKALREKIRSEFEKTAESKEKELGVFAEAETAMAAADLKLPHSKKGLEQTNEEEDRALDKLIEEDASPPENIDKADRKERLKKKPFAVVPVSYPKNVFFESQHMLGRIVVKLNVAHPFYKEVFEPLCGSIETLADNSDLDEGADTPTKKLARRAFLLMLLSYAKAESTFVTQDSLLDNLRSEWGVALATALKN